MRRVVHCECGLGNQMCFYAQLLALKKTHPEDEVFLENFLFDVPGIEKYMKMWNGFELEKVFGIEIQDVKPLLHRPYKDILDEIVESKFWEIDWTASDNVISAILFDNEIISRNGVTHNQHSQSRLKEYYVSNRNTLPGYLLRRLVWFINGRSKMSSFGQSVCFDADDKTEYFSDLFGIISPNSGLESIRKEVLAAFTFPELKDRTNIDVSEKIRRTESVSLHVRKSDCYKYNADCFKFGYFKRSIAYIQAHAAKPEFFIFSDDPKWVMENLKTLGLGKVDKLNFITWNNGTDSYIDMQLMSLCKHNISTNSTFGFWASYLNQNPNKITCAPVGSFAVTNWF